jgi:nicotinamidase-related amidase
VVWIYSEGEDARPGQSGFELAPDFEPATGHARLVKTGSSAFTGTGLGELLEEKGVGRIVFCGVWSNQCVKTTVAASYYDGWLTVVAKDAHSVPLIAGTDEGVKSMNSRWAADRRVELLPGSAIDFDASR